MTVTAMIHRYSIVAPLAVLALLSMPARSADLTINFNGRFLVPTCAFTVNGGNPTYLGSYPNTYFNANVSSPTVQIPIVATGCTAGINTIHLAFSGVADATNNQLFAVNAGSSISGVAIEFLYNAQSTRIQPGSTIDWVRVDPSQPTNTYNIWAHFYRTTGPVAAGNANVPVTIHFTYN